MSHDTEAKCPIFDKLMVFFSKIIQQKRVLSPDQTTATFQPNISQHVAHVLGHPVPTCRDMFGVLAQVWNWVNLSQQHPICHNRMAKRAQHIAPNVVICWVEMLPSFGSRLWDGRLFSLPKK